MKWRQIIVLGACIALPVSAEVFTYKNEQGQTVFTDTPPSGKGEAVEIPPVMTYTPQVEPLTADSGPTLQNPDVGAYKSLRILSPQQDGTVRNNQGIVRFQYQSDPPLQKGDEAVLYLDGQRQSGMEVKGLVRGEHTAQVKIFDINGTEKISSDTVRFYLHHQSRLLKPN